MTRDQIAAWAKKSGLPVSWISDDGILSWADLERFARLVAANVKQQADEQQIIPAEIKGDKRE